MASYSHKNVTATIDGQRVQGFWDGDDAIVVEPVEDIGTLMVGADGSGLFSQRAGRPHTITMRLQHTSPAHRLLHQKWRAQQAVGVRVRSFRVTVMDVDSNEGGVASECWIQSAPSDSKGVNAVAREWVVVTADWTPEVPNAG